MRDEGQRRRPRGGGRRASGGGMWLAECAKQRVLNGCAGRKLPNLVAFRLCHLWGCLAAALAAREVPPACSCRWGSPPTRWLATRKAAPHDSPAAVNACRTCLVSANCHHRCTAAGSRRNCADWLPVALRRKSGTRRGCEPVSADFSVPRG
jgi:hypothetical protein